MKPEPNLTQEASTDDRDPLARLEGSIMARRRGLAERLEALEGCDAVIELREGRELRCHISACKGDLVLLAEGGRIPVVAIRDVARGLRPSAS